MMSIHPQTIYSLLKEKREKHPAHEAIVYPERSLRYSYEAFYREVKETGKGLMALGVQKGPYRHHGCPMYLNGLCCNSPARRLEPFLSP